MTVSESVVHWIAGRGACVEAIQWLRTQLDRCAADVIRACPRGYWLLWLQEELGIATPPQILDQVRAWRHDAETLSISLRGRLSRGTARQALILAERYGEKACQNPTEFRYARVLTRISMRIESGLFRRRSTSFEPTSGSRDRGSLSVWVETNPKSFMSTGNHEKGKMP